MLLESYVESDPISRTPFRFHVWVEMPEQASRSDRRSVEAASPRPGPGAVHERMKATRASSAEHHVTSEGSGDWEPEPEQSTEKPARRTSRAHSAGGSISLSDMAFCMDFGEENFVPSTECRSRCLSSQASTGIGDLAQRV